MAARRHAVLGASGAQLLAMLVIWLIGVNIIWHVLPFQLRPDAVGATSRRIAICVGTQMAARRHAVLGASGAQLLAMLVIWLIGGKAKM